jgi:hypothetical protein
VGSAFGSKTTHSMLARIDASMKRTSRRTFTYFQTGSVDSVRSPHTRISRATARRSRMTLTPFAFRTSLAMGDHLDPDGPGASARDAVPAGRLSRAAGLLAARASDVALTRGHARIRLWSRAIFRPPNESDRE